MIWLDNLEKPYLIEQIFILMKNKALIWGWVTGKLAVKCPKVKMKCHPDVFVRGLSTMSQWGVVVYTCFYFCSMQGKIALPGWLHAF